MQVGVVSEPTNTSKLSAPNIVHPPLPPSHRAYPSPQKRISSLEIAVQQCSSVHSPQKYSVYWTNITKSGLCYYFAIANQLGPKMAQGSHVN